MSNQNQNHMHHHQVAKARERVPTGRRGRPSKSMIAAALERPFCAYLHKICLNNRLEGHKYCIDHIMNDKTAPYRQCTYVHSITGRRCARAAHKVDRRASPLCHYHRSLKMNLPPTPPASIIEELSNSGSNLTKHELLDEHLAHYKRNRSTETRIQSRNTFWNSKANGSAEPSAKLNKVLAKYNLLRQTGNRYSIDQQLVELPTIEEVAARHNNADSDTESVDNNLDLFKHASVFTEEELTRTLRDKMIKLRRLYIEQYGHIQYILKEKRLKYIQAQRNEDEIYGDVFSYRNYRDSPNYDKLRAMLRYHKTFGPESLLQEQAKRRKLSRPPTVGPHPHPHHHHHHHHNNHNQTQQSQNQQVEGSNDTKPAAAGPILVLPTSSDQHQICILSKTPQACTKPCIPLSAYCRQHILYDNKQALFRPCAGGIPPCLTPVVSFTRKNKCWLHTAIN